MVKCTVHFFSSKIHEVGVEPQPKRPCPTQQTVPPTPTKLVYIMIMKPSTTNACCHHGNKSIGLVITPSSCSFITPEDNGITVRKISLSEERLREQLDANVEVPPSRLHNLFFMKPSLEKVCSSSTLSRDEAST
jgi:hypothetical protein